MDNTKQKTVLIIGGAAGIGKEIALDFVQAGHKVAIADINEAAMSQVVSEHKLEDKLFTFQVDVSSWESVQRMAEKVKEALGNIQILVYSAGITKRIEFSELDWSLWKKTIAINLHGLFYSIKAISPYMIEQKMGSIIIIGSGSAITGSGGGVQYSSSKGGAFGLMRSLVTELGRNNITINVIAPRVIESQMLDVLYPTEQSRESLKKEIPIGRFGKPSDISSLVEYLSTDEAKYIHGQILVLDGGRTYKGKMKQG
ncbi:SDR family NAD(P)-dependent oxidoreductase [Fodinisporobacter ferrooxydans]|uniref:SDR family NAD(P)-dependent oxidoreductase n=1 Tax=Fodinisporobacter ferrooxydans TaxID=2901836 RepID=UPI003242003D